MIYIVLGEKLKDRYTHTHTHPHTQFIKRSLLAAFSIGTVGGISEFFTFIGFMSNVFNWTLPLFLEKAVAPHSSVLAWRIPGTWEPGGLLSMESHRVGHD